MSYLSYITCFECVVSFQSETMHLGVSENIMSYFQLESDTAI